MGVRKGMMLLGFLGLLGVAACHGVVAQPAGQDAARAGQAGEPGPPQPSRPGLPPGRAVMGGVAGSHLPGDDMLAGGGTESSGALSGAPPPGVGTAAQLGPDPVRSPLTPPQQTGSVWISILAGLLGGLLGSLAWHWARGRDWDELLLAGQGAAPQASRGGLEAGRVALNRVQSGRWEALLQLLQQRGGTSRILVVPLPEHVGRLLAEPTLAGRAIFVLARPQATVARILRAGRTLSRQGGTPLLVIEGGRALGGSEVSREPLGKLDEVVRRYPGLVVVIVDGAEPLPAGDRWPPPSELP